MKKSLLLAVIVLLIPSAVESRTRVHIYKDAPSYQPVTPLAIIPPLAIFLDLARRTSCDSTIAVATGPNDPGFNSFPPGNYMIPAIHNRCNPQVTPYRRRE